MPVIILDRDGVINADSDEYIKSVAEWRPLPGSLDAIARLHQAGYPIGIIINTDYFRLGRIHIGGSFSHNHFRKYLSLSYIKESKGKQRLIISDNHHKKKFM